MRRASNNYEYAAKTPWANLGDGALDWPIPYYGDGDSADLLDGRGYSFVQGFYQDSPYARDWDD